MKEKEAKIKIDELKEKLEYYAKKYYDDDKPEISDYEYDMMMLELKALEKEFPELITKDSLTQKKVLKKLYMKFLFKVYKMCFLLKN